MAPLKKSVGFEPDDTSGFPDLAPGFPDLESRGFPDLAA